MYFPLLRSSLHKTSSYCLVSFLFSLFFVFKIFELLFLIRNALTKQRSAFHKGTCQRVAKCVCTVLQGLFLTIFVWKAWKKCTEHVLHKNVLYCTINHIVLLEQHFSNQGSVHTTFCVCIYWKEGLQLSKIIKGIIIKVILPLHN